MRTHYRSIEVSSQLDRAYSPEVQHHGFSDALDVSETIKTQLCVCQIERITGSTARVYLEYIQRNLPEGVAMEVTKVTS